MNDVVLHNHGIGFVDIDITYICLGHILFIGALLYTCM